MSSYTNNYNSYNDTTSSSDDDDDETTSTEETSTDEEEDEEDEEGECSIKEDKLMATCLQQHFPNGKKCFRNKCLDVLKWILVSPEPNLYGNIVEVKGNGETYIVKWNKYEKNIDEFKEEIIIHNEAAKLGVAPKLLQVYEDESLNYIYIFMEDILSNGYLTILDYYKNNIPTRAYEQVAGAIRKLHNIGIANMAIYPGNVFTNGKNVMFLDYSLSKTFKKPSEHEKYKTYRKFINSKEVEYKQPEVKNWSNNIEHYL